MGGDEKPVSKKRRQFNQPRGGVQTVAGSCLLADSPIPICGQGVDGAPLSRKRRSGVVNFNPCNLRGRASRKPPAELCNSLTPSKIIPLQSGKRDHIHPCLQPATVTG